MGGISSIIIRANREERMERFSNLVPWSDSLFGVSFISFDLRILVLMFYLEAFHKRVRIKGVSSLSSRLVDI